MSPAEYDFVEYMDDTRKGARLYSAQGDPVTDEGKRSIQRAMNKAQRDGSPLWCPVISFTDEYL